MQLKEQLKGREWKVIAAVTTAGALGFSGLALAGPGSTTQPPATIDLREQTSVTSVTSNTGSSTDFTYPSYMFSASADTAWDSPFDTNTPSPSPDTSSPDTSSPDTSSPDTSSPDTSSPDTSSPDTSSPDSVSGSPDSPSSADS